MLIFCSIAKGFLIMLIIFNFTIGEVLMLCHASRCQAADINGRDIILRQSWVVTQRQRWLFALTSMFLPFLFAWLLFCSGSWFWRIVGFLQLVAVMVLFFMTVSSIIKRPAAISRKSFFTGHYIDSSRTRYVRGLTEDGCAKLMPIN